MKFSEAFEQWQKNVDTYLICDGIAYFRRDDDKNGVARARKLCKTISGWNVISSAKPLFECWLSEMLKDTWEVREDLP